ncbi:hypothetical protein RCC89_20355 [Cytophagaceae bacterium ABcell3]|nr:hypothetical protein RCC89_20355 [Cytophagaceae bacterium ABcell3]
MRKILGLTLLLFIALAGDVCAQKKGTKFGLRFGAGNASISDAGFADARGTSALSGGITINHQFSENFGLVTDLLYTRKGTSAVGVALWETDEGQSIQHFRDTYTLDYVGDTGKLLTDCLLVF